MKRGREDRHDVVFISSLLTLCAKNIERGIIKSMLIAFCKYRIKITHNASVYDSIFLLKE
jgi:hypothetical protein